MMGSSSVSPSDWLKGILLSIAASLIGGAAKLAIRKSWLLEHDDDDDEHRNNGDDEQEQLHHEITPTDMESSLRRGGNSSYQTMGAVTTMATTRTTLPSAASSSTWCCSCCRPPICLRLAGMFGMTFLNPLCGVFAMNYASPSILAPFSGLTLVWIVLCSQQLIGERPSQRQVIAAALIVLGEVIVAVFGDHTNDVGVSVKEVRASYHEVPFLLFFVVSILWFLQLGRWMQEDDASPIARFAWGVSGGSLTAFQNFLKDSLTLVKAVKDEELAESAKIPWGLLIFLIGMAMVTSFGGLLFLTACMKRYDATYSAAMFVGSFVVAASIMSAIHYDTFQHLTYAHQLALYPAGLFVLVVGVYLLLFPNVHQRVAPVNESSERSVALVDH